METTKKNIAEIIRLIIDKVRNFVSSTAKPEGADSGAGINYIFNRCTKAVGSVYKRFKKAGDDFAERSKFGAFMKKVVKVFSYIGTALFFAAAIYVTIKLIPTIIKIVLTATGIAIIVEFIFNMISNVFDN